MGKSRRRSWGEDNEAERAAEEAARRAVIRAFKEARRVSEDEMTPLQKRMQSGGPGRREG